MKRLLLTFLLLPSFLMAATTVDHRNDVAITTASTINGITSVAAVNGITVASGGGASFGSSALLDNFDRANGSLDGSTASGGGTWTQFDSGHTMDISGSHVRSLSGLGLARLSTAFGPDTEAFLMVVDVSGGTPSSGDVRGIGVRCDTGQNGYFVFVDTDSKWRIETGWFAGSTIAGPATQAIAVGDQIGIEAIGTTVKAWYKPSGGAWTALLTVTDSTFAGSGKIAITAQASSYGPDSDDLHGGNR